MPSHYKYQAKRPRPGTASGKDRRSGREIPIMLRLTPDEFLKIQLAAIKAGKTPTGWVRAMALNAAKEKL